jgi:hypothetical protein
MAQAIGQETRRWFSDSISPSHHGHHDTPLFGNTPLYAKFALVGNRPRSACQEKTITFDGAQLPQTYAITPIDSKPKEEDGRNLLYKNK